MWLLNYTLHSHRRHLHKQPLTSGPFPTCSISALDHLCTNCHKVSLYSTEQTAKLKRFVFLKVAWWKKYRYYSKIIFFYFLVTFKKLSWETVFCCEELSFLSYKNQISGQEFCCRWRIIYIALIPF